jgi:Uma2 family endonuclease
MLTEEIAAVEEIAEVEEMPSFNRSYLCWQILQKLAQNEAVVPLPELTLDIANGITPDISVFPQETVKPNFLRDIPKYPKMPTLAIEIISASQNIQDLLEKAQLLVEHGVKAVWTIEPFGNTVFVTTKEGEKRYHDQEVESEGIKVDFRQIFAVN